MDVRAFRSSGDLGIGCRGFAQPDVLTDGAMKQKSVLVYHRYLLPERSE